MSASVKRRQQKAAIAANSSSERKKFRVADKAPLNDLRLCIVNCALLASDYVRLDADDTLGDELDKNSYRQHR